MLSGLSDFDICFLGQAMRSFLSPHAVSFQRDAMGIVDDAVEDSIGDRGLADHFVPGRHRELGGDERGSAAIPFLEDFEQIKALLIVETMGTSVIQNEQLNAGKLVDDAWEATVEARECKILEQARHAQI